VRHRTLIVDAGVAVAVAALVLILAPGLAVAGMIAIFVLLVCGLSLALDAGAARRGRARRVRRAGRR
jgi:hypothetical protein